MLWDCIFRLLLAGVLGGVIGWDREYRAKEKTDPHFVANATKLSFVLAAFHTTT